MAALSKQGTELLRNERFACTVSWRSNGVKMVNHGSGWKIAARRKKGVTLDEWVEYVGMLREKRKKFAAERPAYEHCKDVFRNMTNARNRAVVFSVASMLLPGEADGFYTEMDDHRVGEFSLEDAVELDRAWAAMVREREIIAKEKETMN